MRYFLRRDTHGGQQLVARPNRLVHVPDGRGTCRRRSATGWGGQAGAALRAAAPAGAGAACGRPPPRWDRRESRQGGGGRGGRTVRRGAAETSFSRAQMPTTEGILG